jgi:High potential iron-sulfur protein
MTNAGRAPCHTRRTLLQAAAGALALLAAPQALARMPLLKGTESDAIALEFVPDASRIDPATQPRFAPGSRCSRCYFFRGDASDAAPCTVFAGYRVPPTGWCREFAPRPGS